MKIRQVRRDYKLGQLSAEKYAQAMQAEIRHCVQVQDLLLIALALLAISLMTLACP
jgi:methionine synthase II (cobalamin-independent)